MRNLQAYLSDLVERGGSDLHLVANRVPRVRVDGRLMMLEEAALSVEEFEGLLKEIESGLQGAVGGYAAGGQQPGDCTLHIETLGRFRCHVYRQGGLPAMAIRYIPLHIPSLNTLGLPQVLGDLTKKMQGLVIVAGPPGSGKSTSAAALIDKVNEERQAHILTIERPIEFLHSDKKGLVSQREFGVDVPTLSLALSSVPREDVDVLLIEDDHTPETFETALTLSESGHLVFLTIPLRSCLLGLHSVVQGIPAERQTLLRHRLAMVLEGMVAQNLIPRFKAPGRVLALEILVPTAAVRGLIRDDKIRQIYSIMQTGQAKHGMQTMNQALTDLYRRRLISGSGAFGHSSLPDELRQMIHRTDVRGRE